MQNGVIVISQKELTRYDVLRRVLDGTINLTDAANYMGVSYRQALRLKKSAEGGAAGLVHGNRGRRPSNKINDDVRRRVIELSRDQYPGFNDTHFTEELVKEGIVLSRESVRAIRRGAGVACKRKRQTQEAPQTQVSQDQRGLDDALGRQPPPLVWQGS